MDPSVAGSPPPDGPTGSDAAAATERTGFDSARLDPPPPARVAGLSDEAISIEREIEALKAFLARYPGRRAEEPAGESDEAAPDEERAAPPMFDEEAAEDAPVRLLGTRRRQLAAAAALVAILAVAVPRLTFQSAAGEEAATGTLSISTNPSGIGVIIDGTPRNTTPVTVTLSAGEHVVELLTGTERRRIPVTITAGGQVSHFLELAPLALELSKAPASPPTPAVATAGSRDPIAAGWIAVTAPSDVQVRENGRLIGSSSVERIMLPTGRHELEFGNEALGYRAVQTVTVSAGNVTPIKLRWPEGSLALNAIPWAEVWVDGRPVGETPIGNLTLPIGIHEVIFRHPELGERRASVTVTVGKPATLGVDLGAK